MRDKRALPNISQEAIDAYRRKAGSDLHVALGLAPWEISPLIVARIPEPDRETSSPWFSSWWMANRLREMLEAAASAREDSIC